MNLEQFTKERIEHGTIGSVVNTYLALGIKDEEVVARHLAGLISMAGDFRSLELMNDELLHMYCKEFEHGYKDGLAVAQEFA